MCILFGFVLVFNINLHYQFKSKSYLLQKPCRTIRLLNPKMSISIFKHRLTVGCLEHNL